MNVLIVDDEPLAREEVRLLLAAHPDVTVCGECGNAFEAMAAINRQRPDVVFLDIQMPRITGLEMLAMLDAETMPAIVFLTAFDAHAVQAFEDNAFDYLLKPADPVRIGKTLERVRKHLGKSRSYAVLTGERPLQLIPCYGVNRILLLKREEIAFAVSGLRGVHVVDQAGQEHFTELTLRTLEERAGLVHCHRQYLVNPSAIAEICLGENGAAEIVLRSGQRIPVSRRHLKPLKQHLGIEG